MTGEVSSSLDIGFRGGYRISERGGGVLKCGVFAFLRDVFFSLYEVWGSPKRGGGILTPRTTPGSTPGFDRFLERFGI